MKVLLKLVATYREYLPPENNGKVEIDVPGDATVISVLTDLGVPIDGSVILVDGRAADPGETLQEGNVVFAFPAAAGG